MSSGLASGLLGCQDIQRFDTAPDEAYCGSMVGAPSFQDGILPDGVPPALRAKLTLDTSNLASEPGVLTTDDAARGLCSAQNRPLVFQAPLRALKEAFHDPISNLEFGNGHVHDFLAWVDSECQGPLLAVVSLMQNEEIELRLLKPASKPEPNAPAAQRPGFALFHLKKRQARSCGF